jgi:hypothetical protein
VNIIHIIETILLKNEDRLVFYDTLPMPGQSRDAQQSTGTPSWAAVHPSAAKKGIRVGKAN